MNDDLLFADDEEEEPSEQLGSWKVLVVDDEPEVHAVTKLALSDFVLNGKTLDFISAYSGAEAKKLFREHTDIAVVLLDVVMETDDAGLKVAEYVRNDLDNHFTRIILRTGQPGQAPEKDVIINYDINDYKSKTELTAQKLFTVIIAALRSYRDIIVIEENRKGLEKIIDASADMFSTRSLEKFMQGIIQQLSSILGCSQDAAYITSTVAIPQPINEHDPEELYVFAGNGEYSGKEGIPLREAVTPEEYELCRRALQDKTIVYAEDHVVAYCDSKSRKGSLLYMSGLPRRIGDTDKRLVKLFSDNVQIAFENVLMTSEIEATQREIIERLGKAMECDSPSSQHILRMVKMADLLAVELGLTESERTLLRLAVPLHDVGNTRVPAQILEKTEPLTDDEKYAIRQHAEFGYQILKDSSQPTIQLAATLARQHHERWDGKGYPDGLKKDEVRIESRIATLVDVFDALYNKRPYKSAWPMEKVIDTLKIERGGHFEPRLVDIVIEHIDAFIEIQRAHPDEE
ncbi:response regulator [Alteromonas antoniana]|uniref:response regulator n=1 Tax=Alteromonas antoniana TaxID=2803813 RepID=UPI001C4908F9|nr:response regulator [Alteromonas antoniana]